MFGGSLALASSSGSDWFCYLGGWEVGDQPIVVIDAPAAVQELPKFGLGAGIASAALSRWDIYDESVEADRVVVCDSGLIAQGKDALQIEARPNLAPGFPGL